MALEIDLEELVDVVNTIIKGIIERSNSSKIVLDVSEYWMVHPDEKYNFDGDPDNFVIGKLEDDWDYLKLFLAEKFSNSEIMFIHLAPILLAIADSAINKRPSTRHIKS